MKIFYPVLYRRNAAGKVVSFYFPDLNYEFDMAHQEEEPKDLDNFASQILLEQLNSLKSQQVYIPRPKKLADYKKQAVSSNDFWTKAHVDFEFNKGFFEKNLPKFGLFSTIITSLTMAFIYFSAILITSGITTSSLAFTIIGVFCSTTMAVVIYHFSQAGKLSMGLGKILDDTFTHSSQGRPPINCATLTHQFKQLNKHSTAAMLAKLAVTAIPVTASTFSSIGHYREVKAMGDNINDDQIVFKLIYSLINDTMIVFSAYSLLTFQTSFLPQVFKLIDHVLEPAVKNRNASLSPSDAEQTLPSGSNAENVNLLVEMEELPKEQTSSLIIKSPFIA